MNLIDKKILVTGSGGFLGKHVVRELTSIGCHDLILPRSKQYDLTQQSEVKKLFQTYRPEVVIHLAAVVGGIGFNQANPARLFYANAIMGTELIEQSYRYGIKKYINVGTVCAYPEKVSIPFQENDLWAGYPEKTNAPYGLAKKMQLVQCQAYRDQYGFNAIYLLPVNLYGPEDNFDLQDSHIIPALIRKTVEAHRASAPHIELWGDGTATREFLFVEDAARGIVLAAQGYDGREPVNLGTGLEISIRELAEVVCEQVGYKGKIKWDPSKPNGQMRRRLEISRALKEFAFQSKISLSEGLARTIRWYQQSQSRSSLSSSRPAEVSR